MAGNKRNKKTRKTRLRQKNMTKDEFMSMALENLFKHKISVHFGSVHEPTPSKKKEVSAIGYFSDEEKMLFCKIDHKDEYWFEVFVHEYCHFLQYLDRVFTNTSYWSDLDSWLLNKNKRLSKKRLNRCIEVIRNCELDCEKRAVALIKKHSLPIDLGAYIQKGNAYILFYTLVKRHRLWYTTSPCVVPDLCKTMPSKAFLTKWEEVPAEFEKLVIDKCF